MTGSIVTERLAISATTIGTIEGTTMATDARSWIAASAPGADTSILEMSSRVVVATKANRGRS